MPDAGLNLQLPVIAISRALPLAVVALNNPTNRKVFVEFGPVKTKRRYFNSVELFGCALGELRIFFCRKAKLRTALENDNNKTLVEMRGARCVNQGARVYLSAGRISTTMTAFTGSSSQYVMA